MRALDLDMDFFLSGPCALAPVGMRPPEGEAQPWTEDAVRSFLENNCGLSRKCPIPGAVFETHDMALEFWRKNCALPIDVTHVDAHSDLGIGKPGPGFVLESVITRRPDSRGTIEEFYEKKQLDEANYLLFAIAFRWVSSLENVRNPNSRPDIPSFCGEGSLKLESSAGRILPMLNHHEPEIPFRVYDDWRDFSYLSDGTTNGRPYDCATMAISPRYSPASADFMIDIFKEYIIER